jgi:hypothetical protein
VLDALVGRIGGTPVAVVVEAVEDLVLDGIEEEEEEDGGRVEVAVVEGTTIVLIIVLVWIEVEEATELVKVWVTTIVVTEFITPRWKISFLLRSNMI